MSWIGCKDCRGTGLRNPASASSWPEKCAVCKGKGGAKA